MNFSPQPSRPIGKMRITAETPISQRGKKMMNEITLDPFVQWLNVPPEHTSKHFTTFNSADQLGSHNGHHLPESIYIQGPVQGGLRTFLAGITTAHSTSAQSNPPQHFSYSTSPSPAPSGNNYLDTPLSHFTYSANPTLQELSTGTGGSSSSGSNGMLASHQRQPSRSVSPVPFHQYFNPSNLSHNSFSAADLFASHPYEFASGV
ncbi:hypothetical protein FA15DRAFT_129411 [Coprinopsis marcescibilis]|uniref:Uncharacterized protein n=1 Tax=Coprinopsis marcescibilis TaxID=230819 RepID=A0A5C3KJI1_COPMA|nr:hypothetical protein FA15DRAFT_129411 [Coprinopsis marcescibilis]